MDNVKYEITPEKIKAIVQELHYQEFNRVFSLLEKLGGDGLKMIDSIKIKGELPFRVICAKETQIIMRFIMPNYVKVEVNTNLRDNDVVFSWEKFPFEDLSSISHVVYGPPPITGDDEQEMKKWGEILNKARDVNPNDKS